MESSKKREGQLRLQALETVLFHEAGAPRALACSNDGKVVCVGLKDGRVLVFPARPAQDFRSEPVQSDAKAEGVRSLCNVTAGGIWPQRWLVGRVGGQVDWLEIEMVQGSPKAKFVGTAINADLKSPDDHTSFIGRLDDDNVIISHGTPRPNPEGVYCAIYRVRNGALVTPLNHFKQVGNLRTVVPLRQSGSDSGSQPSAWLLISYAAEFWILQPSGDSAFTEPKPVDPWSDDQEGWRPALIMDTARIDRSQPASSSVVVSTDLGLYGVTFERDKRVKAKPIHCLGPSGVHLAVTSATISEREEPREPGIAKPGQGPVYLWSADASGASHLMRTDTGEYDDARTWHRVQFAHGESPAIQAVALATRLPPEAHRSEGKGDAIVVWQTRRDESIAFSVYAPVPEGKDGDPVRLAHVTRFDQIGPFLRHLYAGDDIVAVIPWIRDRTPPPPSVVEIQQRVADVLDLLPEHGDQLREFLSDPKPELVIDALKLLLRAGGQAEAAAASIHLWNHTLVGTLLRCNLAGDDELALGIIRWHQRVYRKVRPADPAVPGMFQEAESFQDAVIQAVKAALFDARRWTVFAPRGADDGYRFYMARVAKQIRELGDAPWSSSADRSRPQSAIEDLLSKQCILFKYRVDDEGRLPPSDDLKGLAFDLHDVGVGRDTLVAGLWRKSSIRLFRVSQDERGDAQLEHVTEIGAPTEDEGSAVAPDDVRFGRAISFWPGPDRDGYSLLTSVRVTRGDDEHERLVLYRCAGGGTPDPLGRPWQRHALELLALDGAAVAIGDGTVLGMYTLAPGLIALGVRTRSKPPEARNQSPSNLDPPTPNLMIVRVHDDRATVIAHCVLPSAYATLQSSPVTCVSALLAPPLPGQVSGEQRWYIVAGMDDGQIVLAPLLVPENGGPGRFEAPIGIGRLSAPIWRLASREVSLRPHDGANSPASTLAGPKVASLARLRVFAGSADGHIVAFESQADARSGDHTEDRTPRRFARLWATRDRGSIVGLWCFDADLRPPAEGGEDEQAGGGEDHGRTEAAHRTPLVLAATREGRAILFGDYDTIQPGSQLEIAPERLRRPRVPGQRLERFMLRSNVFAAARADGNVQQQRGGPVSRLLLVSGDSEVRLVALNLPKWAPARRKRYERIWETYFLRVCGRDAKIDDHMLRYAEALRRLAPELWLIPIPSFLKRDRQGKLFAVPAAWYPLYQRPFRIAAELYAELQKRLEADGETRLPTTEELNELESMLEVSLAVARRLGDRHLFKEMIEATLKRFNYTLIEVARNRPERHEALFDLYSRILGVVDRACHGWLGSDTESYARVQITRAKNLVDGDVLSQLATALEEHAGRAIDAEPEPTAGAAQTAPAGERPRRRLSALDRLVGLRVDSVSYLLSDGAPLVPLETLRATNLSLLRAAWFMHHDTSSLPRELARPWPRIDRFLRALGNFASQASHTADDALAHEIVRAYAVSLFIAPHEATRVAISACSAALPEALWQRIENQVELTATLLGIRAPRAAVDAYKQALREPPRHAPSAPAAGPGAPAVPQADAERLYRAQQEWFAAFAPYRKVLDWLDKTALGLETLPGSVSFSEVVALATHVATGIDPAEPNATPADAEHCEHYTDDKAFWQQQLGELSALCAGAGLAKITPDIDRRSVPPAYVLYGPSLAEWCKRAMESPAFQKIRQPQRGVYRAALERLKNVASKLRASTAVQQQLVTGVLSHHLMEALDQHVLQLTEQAHVLYPVKLSGISGDGEELDEVADPSKHSGFDAFALVLHAQAKQARAIPKNLRALYQLVKPPSATSGEDASIIELVEHAFQGEGLEIRIDRRAEGDRVEATTASRLRMVIAEIASNHRIHGLHDASRPPRARWSDKRLELIVPVSIANNPADEQKRLRLESLAQSRLQKFLERVEGESTGVGLCLANLAAAGVGWRLELQYENPDIEATFVLSEAGV